MIMSIFIYFEEPMLFSPSRPPSWNPPPGRRRKIVPLICSYMLNFITTMKALICCGLDSCVWYTSCSVITLPEKRVPRPVSSHTAVCKHPLRWCVLVGVYPGRVRETPSHSLLHLTANLSNWPHMSVLRQPMWSWGQHAKRMHERGCTVELVQFWLIFGSTFASHFNWILDFLFN